MREREKNDDERESFFLSFFPYSSLCTAGGPQNFDYSLSLSHHTQRNNNKRLSQSCCMLRSSCSSCCPSILPPPPPPPKKEVSC